MVYVLPEKEKFFFYLGNDGKEWNCALGITRQEIKKIKIIARFFDLQKKTFFSIKLTQIASKFSLYSRVYFLSDVTQLSLILC